MQLSDDDQEPDSELTGDPRFRRGRCAFDGLLYAADQTALFEITRVADDHKRVVRLCFRCSHSMPDNFTATKVAKRYPPDLA